ncbi:MAG: HD domain-containing protein [Bilifractor sp.]
METETETNSEEVFHRALNRLKRDRNVLKMQQFSQHRGNTTYQHCVNVAKCSFYLAQKLHWNIDENALATGAMLHDYYLYTATEEPVNGYRHGIDHPVIALHNAEEIWDLNECERNIIYSHMFPLTITKIPHHKEAWLVSMADKYCALREASTGREGNKEIEPGANTPWISRLFRRRQVA